MKIRTHLVCKKASAAGRENHDGGEGRGMATVLLYAVDLDEMRRWVGSGDATLVREGMTILREDEDADWEAEELALLERLLQRMVVEGRLYEGLGEEEQYYLTQLLVDLFDELMESEAVSDELPFSTLERALAPMHSAGGKQAAMAGWLTRGRYLGTDEFACRAEGEIDEVLPYYGYVTREELPVLIATLEALPSAEPGAASDTGSRRRPGGGRRAREPRGAEPAPRAVHQLLTACIAARDTERDLFAFIA